MSKLSELICGNVQKSHTGNLARSLWHLSQTVRLLEPNLRKMGKKRHPSDRLVSPFLIRSMIEVACTSLIARLDPFRILTLAKIQGQAAYDTTKKVASSIQWQGDIIATDGKVTNLWQTSRKTENMTRALLGDYQDEVFWQPAFLRLLDHLQRNEDAGRDAWLSNLINIDPLQLVPQFRGIAGKIYSSASKGVHHEFVLSISSYYDNATLDELTEEALRFIATMSLIANFAENIAYGLSTARSVKNYKALQLS